MNSRIKFIVFTIFILTSTTMTLASNMLYRIGYDCIEGYLKNGLEQWKASGRDSGSIEELSIDKFGELQTRREIKVIDVREPHEFDEDHIEDSFSYPLTRLDEEAEDIVSEGPIATICHSGNRSTTAASILKRHGVNDVMVFLAGFKTWRAFDYPLERD